MKAILIARVSTEEQREAGNSLPAQLARLEKYCQNRNLEILKICSFDESAFKSQREEFDKILDFILGLKEKIVVCCDKVDRISRNIFDKRVSVLYEKALKDELELHFVSEGQVINSKISAVEKFQFGISLGLAKYYSDAISDNVKRAQEQKLRKGEWLSKAPYGYKNITKPDGSREIIVVEYESAIVQKAFELYSTGLYSMELISKKMKEDYGLDWSISFISKIFKNPFYYGEMLFKGKLYPHKYPPLIPKSTYEKVREIKDGFNKRKIKLAIKYPFIYKGMIKCGDCGLAITAEMHKGYHYYHCTQYNGKHGAKWLREEEITKQIASVFKNLQIPENILEQVVATLDAVHKEKTEFHDNHFDKLVSEQKTLNKMLDNLYLDKLKGRITESEYDKFYISLRDQLTDISIRLEQLQDADDNYFITSKYILKLCSQAHDLFMSSKVEEKRQLVNFVLSNLELKGQNMLFQLQKPFDTILECSEYKLWRP